MRPGPGLVVMALAFISGARRGTSQQHSSSAASSSNKLGKFEEDNTEALSRINPWLSACDLAQPNTAPDLQVSIRSQPSKNPVFPYPFPKIFSLPKSTLLHKRIHKKTLPSKQLGPNCEPCSTHRLQSGTSRIKSRCGRSAKKKSCAFKKSSKKHISFINYIIIKLGSVERESSARESALSQDSRSSRSQAPAPPTTHSKLTDR